ncbi:efflux RND transporter periplasmic adaptor subunit [Croceicoccus sp. F390]|uniref:Efflux RND transporter periplasmic adaptor subunit n=1 Tax=Croceicoccus esteveae TaxID=3075597 RepID=A0ABU2ZLG4_9SPHN|nr:HlyD family efflux transporter periplasmic adaptor subunit [Croceicoccus sp. F390]MDT0577071.1 efflux RND transporter periplasmic adaptor subunit [Croceicoccus sp. F390]
MKKLSFARQVLPVLALVLIALSAWFIWGGQPEDGLTQPAITPPTTPAGQVASVAGVGVVEPSSEVIAIGSNLAGIVTRVFVEEGTQVAQGQPLFTLDDREARADIAEAVARVATARAQVMEAEAALAVARRQDALYADIEDDRAFSRQELIASGGDVSTARARVASARAGVTAAEAALAAARVTLARLTVVAPRTAEVLAVNTRAGEYASAGPAPTGGDPLMELGVTRPLHIRVDIDEDQIARVAIGAPAIVSPRGDAQRRIRAPFVRAEPKISPKRSLTNAATERVDVRVLQLLYVVEPSTDLRVGQQVDAFVPAGAGRGNGSRAGSAPQTDGAQ